MASTRARFPLNAPGDFYVENECCIACEAPEAEAPDLMAHCGPEELYHCYFRKQPSTPEELTSAINAVVVCCCGSVRYGGTDSAILNRLSNFGESKACDFLVSSD